MQQRTKKRNETNYFRKGERINIPSENTVLKPKECRSRASKTLEVTRMSKLFNNARKHNMLKKGNGTIAIDMTGWELW